MAECEDDAEQPASLLAAGWKQGVLFDAPGIAYSLNIGTLENGFALSEVRKIRSRERLVLISHACDIMSGDEKFVEALICRAYDPESKILSRWDHNSPRYFVVDPSAAYVADASHRIKISKEALPTLNHDDLSMDELRLFRFVEWLTRRYDRPTVPDDIYEHFHRPVYVALGGLSAASSAAFDVFNGVTNEIRVALPTVPELPYPIGMVYLTLPALTVEQLESIAEIHRIIAEAASNKVRVAEEPVIAELDEIPFGVLRRTQPFIIEYPSWDSEDSAPPAWMLERYNR